MQLPHQLNPVLHAAKIPRYRIHIRVRHEPLRRAGRGHVVLDIMNARDFDVGGGHNLPAVAVDDAVFQPNAVLRPAKPGKFLYRARRFFGKRVCDLVVHVHNELAGFALMQIHIFLRCDILGHILVHVQMIRREIRHDRDIRRLRHTHELERRELHDGNIARVHFLRPRQKRRSNVAAEPDGVARVL